MKYKFLIKFNTFIFRWNAMESEKQRAVLADRYGKKFKQVEQTGDKLHVSLHGVPQFAKDDILPEFPGIATEYRSLVLQFGFISLFQVAFPLASALVRWHQFIDNVFIFVFS